MFNPRRLSIARKRRRLTERALARKAGLVPDTISRLENGVRLPDEQTVTKLANALDFPVSFFGQDEPEVGASDASFRSFSKMSVRDRDAALTASALGLELSDWIEKRFPLPSPDLLDLGHPTDPDVAASSLRQYWALEERPIGNLLSFLENKGVRIFSLSENTASVNSFSFWRHDKPFIFLNNFETAERRRYQLAHELGHFMLHRHADPKGIRSAERDANRFASAFLMPERDVRVVFPGNVTVDSIIKEKLRWGVSAISLANRLYNLGLLSTWQYKSTCIKLRNQGTSEPVGIPSETSSVWRKILAQPATERAMKGNIAKDLHLPVDELEGLIWNLAGEAECPESRDPA
jgi:Zn-dependent peptidase ImmA (M78 family)/DNA-binding XRE family transcriptional regulator